MNEMKINAFKASVISLIIVCIQLPCHCVSGENRSVLILAKPQSFLSKLTSNYGQRQTLSEAFENVVGITNNDSSLHSLELITVDSGVMTRYDDPYSGNVLQVIANLTWNNRLNHIIGIVGFIHPELLLTLQKFQVPIASLVHFGTLPNITYLTASTLTLADSLLQFMQTINQTSFGLITELHNSYFLSVSQQLLAKTKNSSLISIKPYVQIGFRYMISNVVDEIAAANVRSIILSVHPSITIQILCEAYKSNLKWPDYVWIMFGYQLDDLVLDDVCSQNITEGILLFQLFPNELIELTTLAHSKSCWSYLNDTISQKLQSENSLTFLIYNAILTLTVSSQNKSSVNWENFYCSNNVIYVYQISRDSLQNHVGFYDGSLHMVTRFCQMFSCRELDLPVVLKDFPLGYLMVLPSLCIITNTVLLVLYLYFHKEPSIKSTSIGLTLVIFISCYIFLFYSILLLLNISPNIIRMAFDVCMVLVWLNGTGMSMPLILAAILVKMVRVYRIFTQHRILKPKIYTSTYAHFLYAILLVSPNIIIILLWTFIDPYRLTHSEFSTEEQCQSRHTTVWSSMLVVYICLLSLTVVVVAIKSRKIRLTLFKDSKEVNIFIFLIIIVGMNTFVYWRIFETFGIYEDIPNYILYTGHMIAPLLCQAILFIPKVWPPVRDKILKKYMPRKVVMSYAVLSKNTATAVVSTCPSTGTSSKNY